MIAYLPIPGGHIKMAERFVDPALSFTMGWNYWWDFRYLVCTFSLNLMGRYNWAIILPAELSAASVLIGFWNDKINPAVWITVCMIVVIVINMLGAGK
jgi:amino acid transporter